ncbi:similar to Saccharomyces cerevisiae YJL060W BNA3 Kynurenine aminotransferase, catalyzes formation of kynurenic acid from kynurenine [Maudiozyma saulgeensis]|uniref:Similar to Saccharomyces cerevisiae YJL060W BNA3 Kynurenine aminotransferase, catalyzes formation of kynurenic acid from kynurenine n=1 Tax=Maudiozyma saulgeensis TaxID=1789683 RepID=A0A1X7QXP4_9SACH|nr:similar to Saccharomyces cerevisiae YJL060W BNA3 Kynurenine aminotransferase, catalyzes formation of kynurenic acid from kynurenine [Kazachstania saulgeensis]
MPYQEDFAVEQFMDKFETQAKYNLGETCCYSLSLDDIEQLSGNRYELDRSMRLTYRDIKGSEELRSLIASIYGNTLTGDNVLVSNGAIASNYLLYYTLVGKGDHVICVDPTYSQLYSVPEMFGAEVDLLKLTKEDGYIPNVNVLAKMIKKNTKLIIINNPNNPLGSVIPNNVMKDICQLCEKHDIYLHSDEVYRPMFHSLEEGFDLPDSACNLYSKAIVTCSMSKAYSVAGIRLGWMITQDKQVLRDAASRRDYNTISVSVIDDRIAQYVLKNADKVIKRNMTLCKENYNYLTEFIEKNKEDFEYVAIPQGGTVCLLRTKKIEDTYNFAEFLATEFNVLAVPGEAFNFPGTLRIGYGNSKDDLIVGLPLLKKANDLWIDRTK